MGGAATATRGCAARGNSETIGHSDDLGITSLPGIGDSPSPAACGGVPFSNHGSDPAVPLGGQAIDCRGQLVVAPKCAAAQLHRGGQQLTANEAPK